MTSHIGKIHQSLIGPKVILSYRGIIPTNQGPNFMNVQVKILEDLGDSIWVEMIEGTNLLKMQICKEVIGQIVMTSDVAVAPRLTLPGNFRS